MLVNDLLQWQERRCVFWWQPKGGAPNVGDYLARVLVARILELADRDITDKRERRKRLFSIGSVLHFARDGDAVWGSGINGKVAPEAHRFAKLDVRAVRGPLTRAFLQARGIECPAVYGDPALLMPLFFPRELVADEIGTQDFVIVPHLNDPPHRYAGYRNHLCSPRQYPAGFVRRLLRARRVISASLHGVILAEAYGIPAVQLELGSGEARFKYDDYYQGTGRDEHVVAGSIDEALALDAAPPPEGLAALAARLLRAFPYDLWDAAPAATASERSAIDASAAESARA